MFQHQFHWIRELIQVLRKRGVPAAALLFGFVMCLGLKSLMVGTPAPVSTGIPSRPRYDRLRPEPGNLRVRLILDRDT